MLPRVPSLSFCSTSGDLPGFLWSVGFALRGGGTGLVPRSGDGRGNVLGLEGSDGLSGVTERSYCECERSGVIGLLLPAVAPLTPWGTVPTRMILACWGCHTCSTTSMLSPAESLMMSSSSSLSGMGGAGRRGGGEAVEVIVMFLAGDDLGLVLLRMRGACDSSVTLVAPVPLSIVIV